MTIVLLGSFSGSPGVTAIAMGLGGSLQDAIVVEADAAGGRLAARWQLRRDPGVLSLAAARGSSDPAEHVQRTSSGVNVLVGTEAGDVAGNVWRSSGAHIATALAQVVGPVVVDVGRYAVGSAAVSAFAGSGAVCFVVVRNDPGELAVAAAGLRSAASPGAPQLVVVGDGPYRPAEVEEVLGAPVAAVVPRDAPAADAAGTGGPHRNLRATPWARAVRTLATSILAGSVGAPLRVEGVA